MRRSHILDAVQRDLEPCKTCGASRGYPCRTPGAHTRSAHIGRRSLRARPSEVKEDDHG